MKPVAQALFSAVSSVLSAAMPGDPTDLPDIPHPQPTPHPPPAPRGPPPPFWNPDGTPVDPTKIVPPRTKTPPPLPKPPPPNRVLLDPSFLPLLFGVTAATLGLLIYLYSRAQGKTLLISGARMLMVYA